MSSPDPGRLTIPQLSAIGASLGVHKSEIEQVLDQRFRLAEADQADPGRQTGSHELDAAYESALSGVLLGRVAAARRAVGLQQDELARSADVDPRASRAYETGWKTPPIGPAQRLIMALDVAAVGLNSRRPFREIRVAAGITEETIATRAGFSTDLVRAIESGRPVAPVTRLDYVTALRDAVDTALAPLRLHRRSLQLTKRGLADRADLSVDTIEGCEKGYHVATIEELAALTSAMNAHASECLSHLHRWYPWLGLRTPPHVGRMSSDHVEMILAGAEATREEIGELWDYFSNSLPELQQLVDKVNSGLEIPPSFRTLPLSSLRQLQGKPHLRLPDVGASVERATGHLQERLAMVRDLVEALGTSLDELERFSPEDVTWPDQVELLRLGRVDIRDAELVISLWTRVKGVARSRFLRVNATHKTLGLTFTEMDRQLRTWADRPGAGIGPHGSETTELNLPDLDWSRAETPGRSITFVPNALRTAERVRGAGPLNQAHFDSWLQGRGEPSPTVYAVLWIANVRATQERLGVMMGPEPLAAQLGYDRDALMRVCDSPARELLARTERAGGSSNVAPEEVAALWRAHCALAEARRSELAGRRQRLQKTLKQMAQEAGFPQAVSYYNMERGTAPINPIHVARAWSALSRIEAERGELR